MIGLDSTDRRIVAALQSGMPIAAEPWAQVAADVGLSVETLKTRLQRMLDSGMIRRIAAVPNHYRLGMSANGMTVWDVADNVVDALGTEIGELPFVSHCYRRPRRLPEWRYNLFAMVHGTSRAEVEQKAETIAGILGRSAFAHDILYSVRILKKTGLRIAG